MRHRSSATPETGSEPGHDSFLDIVTNIVGILIILVMVVGVQAKDAWIEAAADAPAETPEPEEVDVDTSRSAAASIEADIHALLQTAEVVQAETAAYDRRRQQLQLLIEVAKHDLDERRSRLDEDARRDFDLQCELNAARAELDQLEQQQHALAQTQGHVEVLEHLPTPMAKTVFGKEEHFRLERGRLTYVPLNELVNRLKGEWEDKIWRLEDVPQITETIGPVDGFRMKYTLARKLVKMSTPQGPLVGEAVGLTRFILVPVSDQLGEPFAEALQPNSQFRQRLATYDPETTTITVWCYPDTFENFRRLKHELFQLGFLTAGRPLPAGHPIGGSPEGSRSVAE